VSGRRARCIIVYECLCLWRPCTCLVCAVVASIWYARRRSVCHCRAVTLSQRHNVPRVLAWADRSVVGWGLLFNASSAKLTAARGSELHPYVCSHDVGMRLSGAGYASGECAVVVAVGHSWWLTALAALLHTHTHTFFSLSSSRSHSLSLSPRWRSISFSRPLPVSPSGPPFPSSLFCPIDSPRCPPRVASSSCFLLL
jgi:hypothetical protein